ncbi:MAG TPA: hypothetical protein PK695_11470 [Chitinophagaceae bacterium]|jgi:hypothetical protein|nr:hypothetical protein [Chitinophagaceae bacterium]HMW67364.1 hypothetical protein [Chitinophagaceae bacterium]HMX76643.1 hypothetical protein [Chitinophagaceae bacterium]HNA19362.1 hypothetical protein [Chitinophagaceae bacterium]HNA90785.1 hypothetical protein [Chitinophagaceae bacterium]
MLDRLFGRSKKKNESEAASAVVFGRYSDNNKSVAQTARWTDADNLFKEKKYFESLDAFFEYLKDDAEQNTLYERNDETGKFEIFQGSKIVKGMFNRDELKAEVTLAGMLQPSVPVMRRLLESNFSLYYSRFALDDGRLCMRFDSDTNTASPSKLYYGLKELATKADKQDDLLVQEFSSLQAVDNEHVAAIPLAEKEVKYRYFQSWIQQTLDTIASVDADKFSGGNAYLLLALIFRIDFLIAPEGKLLSDLEKINGIYFKKDERQTIEKNQDMVDAFKKLQSLSKEDVMNSLIKSKHTFSIVSPQQYKVIADSINGANTNMKWYVDNNYPFFATQINEYGISYCQYSYSIPRVITEFFHLYMMINYADYFTDLGFGNPYFNAKEKRFSQQAILDKIATIQGRWREKFPLLEIKTQNLRFDNLINFNTSFTTELSLLNTEAK